MPLRAGVGLAAVMAGGRSRRLGADKRVAEVAGVPLATRVQRTLAPLFDQVLFVGRRLEPLEALGLACIEDLPGCVGPLGGLVTALDWAARQGAARVFVTAADMPGLRADAVARVCAAAVAAPAAAWVAPAGEARGIEPLHAVYATDALPALRALNESGEASLHAVVSALSGVVLARGDVAGDGPAAAWALRGINTPEDLAAYAAWESHGARG